LQYRLVCLSCEREFPSSFEAQLCEHCGGMLEVDYLGRPTLKTLLGKDSWSYESLLPEGRYKRYKLGNTTLLRAVEEDLFLKLETENPTRSFKDRGSVIEVAKALEYGFEEVVCASTGNMGYSVAYYAALAGLRSTIFVSTNANRLKVRNIRDLPGARLIRVEGDFTEAQSRAIKYSKRKRAFLAGDYCYRKEGQKTLIYEILAELPDVDYIFIPIGNATLFSGSHKALTELNTYGISSALPHLMAVQASLTNPVTVAYRRRESIEYQKPLTDAGAIAVGYPTYGDQAVEGVRATEGACIDVSDSQMDKERRAFYKEYGLRVEMAGVASVVAFRKSKVKGKSVAVISGGNTLKP
jgi:threonine synthase